jgi:protein-tyrosine sulfotransferase
MTSDSFVPTPNLTLVLGEDGNFQAWSPDRPGVRTTVGAADIRLLADVVRRAPVDATQDLTAADYERLARLGLVARGDAKPLKDQPIFILGAPRSGTTLVRAILDAHHRISCGDESMFVAALLDCYNNWKFRRPLLNYGITDIQMMEFFKSFVLFAHGELAARRGKARWADKTPAYCIIADFIFSMFGHDAKYVVIVRHALDVAVSMVRMVDDGYWDNTMAGFVDGRVRSENPLENAARAWARTSESLQRFIIRNDGILTIRYEDLVTEPDRVIETLFRHLDEEISPDFVTSVFARPLEHGPLKVGQGDPIFQSGARNRFDPSSVGRWKTLNRQQVRSVADIVNPGLQYWGYDCV